MKNKKSRIIIGGISTLLIVCLLLSVFSLFIYQIKDTFQDFEDKYESEIIYVDGEDSNADPSPDTGNDSSPGSDSSDESLDTFTIENGRLGYIVRKGKYNDGSGEVDVYLLTVQTKEAPKSNTTYRVKWNIRDSVFTYFSNTAPCYNVGAGTSLPCLYSYWSVNGTSYINCEGNSNVGRVLNLDYTYSTGEGSYNYIAFGSLALFTEDLDTAYSLANEIIKAGYFSNASIVEEVAE